MPPSLSRSVSLSQSGSTKGGSISQGPRGGSIGQDGAGKGSSITQGARAGSNSLAGCIGMEGEGKLGSNGQGANYVPVGFKRSSLFKTEVGQIAKKATQKTRYQECPLSLIAVINSRGFYPSRRYAYHLGIK